LFLGGWYFPFVLRIAGGYNNIYVFLSLVVFVVKCAILLYVYFWLRWTFPRYRYDQLMDLGWKWMIPAALLNVVWTALTVFLVQALDGWRGIKTIESLTRGLNMTATGKGVAIAMGWAGLLIAAVFLALLNHRSRDFNLKKQRREIRLVDVPKGAPAVATTAAAAATENA